MHEFCFDYVKPKYCENAKLCYMDKDSIIVHLKTDNVYKNTGEDVEKKKLKLQILKQTDNYLQEKIKKSMG